MNDTDATRLKQYAIRLMKVTRPELESMEAKRVLIGACGGLIAIVNGLEDAANHTDDPIPPTLRPGA